MQAPFSEKIELLYDKLNSIQESDYITNSDFKLLCHLTSHKNSDVRAQVTDIFGSLWHTDYNNQLHRLLLKLMLDRNGLVRACACDAIKGSGSIKFLPILKIYAERDINLLVRGYAISSIAQIIVNSNADPTRYIALLKKLLVFERTKWVIVNIYFALHKLGEEEFLGIIINNLNSRYFKIRALAANCLRDCIESHNYKFIKTTLQLALRVEDTVIVRSILVDILERMESQ